MSDTPKPWWLLTPWKYHTRWHRFVGWFCLSTIAVQLVSCLMSDIIVVICALTMTGVLFVLGLVTIIRGVQDERRHKREMKAIHLWSRVVDGEIGADDLTPEQQEDIAVQRAKARMWPEARQ